FFCGSIACIIVCSTNRAHHFIERARQLRSQENIELECDCGSTPIEMLKTWAMRVAQSLHACLDRLSTTTNEALPELIPRARFLIHANAASKNALVVRRKTFGEPHIVALDRWHPEMRELVCRDPFTKQLLIGCITRDAKRNGGTGTTHRHAEE